MMVEIGGVVVSKSEDFFFSIACSARLLSSATLDFFGPNLSRCLAFKMCSTHYYSGFGSLSS